MGIVTTAIILIVTLGALGAGPFVVMLALMGIRSLILGYLVRPAVYGRTVRIHPALVLIVLPAGFQLAGIIGLFVAVPVTAVILAVAGATIAIMEPDPPPPLPSLVPAWLDRAAQSSWRILVVIALIALLVGILVTVPLVVIPVILAIILAATLEPVVQSLMRRGYSRGRAAGIAVGGGFLAVGAILVLTIGSLFGQADEIADTVVAGASSANDSLAGQLGLPSQAVADGAVEAVRTIATLADGVAAMVTVVVLGTLLTFYLLRDGGRLWARLVSRARPAVAGEIDAAGTRAFEVLGGYMIGTAAISFVGAASQFVIMVVLGLPLALPVFVLSFFLSFIPYIGGFISTGIAFLIAIAVGSPTTVLVMAIWTIVFNLVTGNIVSPIVYGRTVHIHPAIVLLAIPAGAAVAGHPGHVRRRPGHRRGGHDLANHPLGYRLWRAAGERRYRTQRRCRASRPRLRPDADIRPADGDQRPARRDPTALAPHGPGCKTDLGDVPPAKEEDDGSESLQGSHEEPADLAGFRGHRVPRRRARAVLHGHGHGSRRGRRSANLREGHLGAL